MVAARSQRYAVILQAYNCQVEYQPSTEHGNVDALSVQQSEKKEAEIFFFSGLDDLPVDTKDIWERPEKILY